MRQYQREQVQTVRVCFKEWCNDKHSNVYSNSMNTNEHKWVSEPVKKENAENLMRFLIRRSSKKTKQTITSVESCKRGPLITFRPWGREPTQNLVRGTHEPARELDQGAAAVCGHKEGSVLLAISAKPCEATALTVACIMLQDRRVPWEERNISNSSDVT